MEAYFGGRGSEPSDWYSCWIDGYGTSLAVNHTCQIKYTYSLCGLISAKVIFVYVFFMFLFVFPGGCSQAHWTRAEGLCKGRGSGRRGPVIHQNSSGVWWGAKRS